MKRIFNIPKVQMTITLLLIFSTAFGHNPSVKSLMLIFVAIFSTIISDFVFAKIRKVPFFPPFAAIVTGLIIALLVSPTLPLYQPIIIGIIAMLSKNFLRVSNRHVFNPASVGLLIGSFVFSQNVSWWGVSFQQFSIFHLPSTIYFLILLSPALVSLYRMRRYRIAISFLLLYFILNAILSSSLLNFNSILNSTVLFFSIVMLIEPMTTPNRPRPQILFGIFVAITSFLLSSPILNSSFSILNSLDPLLLSLLIGNLIFFKFR